MKMKSDEAQLWWWCRWKLMLHESVWAKFRPRARPGRRSSPRWHLSRPSYDDDADGNYSAFSFWIPFGDTIGSHPGTPKLAPKQWIDNFGINSRTSFWVPKWTQDGPKCNSKWALIGNKLEPNVTQNGTKIESKTDLKQKIDMRSDTVFTVFRRHRSLQNGCKSGPKA